MNPCIIAILLIASCTPIVTAQNVGYNKTCSDEVNYHCDFKLGLNCLSGHCLCEPGEAIFDLPEWKCLRLENSDCFPKPLDGEERKCVPNANCDALNDYFGICKCAPGFSRDEHRFCKTYRQQGYQQHCDDQSYICDYKLGLTCHKFDDTNSYCNCASGGVYDRIQNQCLRLENSDCYPTPLDGEQRNCIANAKCDAVSDYFGICKCNEESGFVKDDQNFCVSSRQQTHRQFCDDEVYLCDYTLGLKCQQQNSAYSHCDCDRKEAIYDSTTKQCLRLAGVDCFLEPLDGERRLCVPNAKCSDLGIPVFGICECNAGYLSNDNLLCVATTSEPQTTTTTTSTTTTTPTTSTTAQTTTQGTTMITVSVTAILLQQVCVYFAV